MPPIISCRRFRKAKPRHAGRTSSGACGKVPGPAGPGVVSFAYAYAVKIQRGGGALFALSLLAFPFASNAQAVSASTSIVSLQAEVATLEAELIALQSVHAAFPRALSLGSSGSDVSALQRILKSQGFYSYPTITGYFGTVTKQALMAYQKAHNLYPVGYAGPLTRALLGGSTAATSATPTSSATTATTTTAVSAVPPTASGAAGLVAGQGGYGGGGGDRTPPTITLRGANPMTVAQGSAFADPGASATDNVDGTDPVTVSGSVNTAALGTYTLTYTATDRAGNAATATRTVNVTDQTPPVITAITTSQISSTTETILWTTSEPATSVVSYGLTTGYGSASSTAALATLHSITLKGLTASTTYSFQVASADASSNTTTSTNQTFTTAAYNYYVDSVNGSDSNPGTSPALAFQNITALPTITAGKTVALADNSYWRQQLTINAANVTVTNYGSGALPILDGSDIIPNANFTKTAGYSNVYNTATTTFLMGGASAWVNMWETGAPGDNATGQFLANATSIASVDSTACSYYIPTMTSSFMPTAEPMYIHSCDGSSPITNGYKYEFANRAAGLLMTGLAGNVSNIEGRKSAGNDGPLAFEGDGNSYVINGVIARDGGKHNLRASGGSIVENSVLIDEYYPAVGGLLVFFDQNGSGLPITSSGNIFQLDQNVPGNSIPSIISHTGAGLLGAATSTNDWFIQKNATTAMTGISFSGVPSVSISGDYGSGVNAAIAVGATTTLINSQFYNNPTQPVTNSGFLQYLAAVPATLSNDLFCGSAYNQFVSATGQAGASLNLNNVKMFVTGAASFYFLGFINSNTSLALTVNNSDFGSADGNRDVYYLTGSGATFAGGQSGNANIYESPLTNFELNGTSTSTLSGWQSMVSPQDSAATSSGGTALSSACTLPTIPTVN